MKIDRPFSILKTLFALLLLVLFGSSAQIRAVENSSGPADTSSKYILFLTADGFRTDYIEWYNPTHLKELIAEGVRVTHVKNVIPTVTAPNMTSLVTGAYPRTTGIAGNSQYQKEEDRIFDKNRGNKAETIAETLHKAGWKTAGVNHFMLDGRGADFYAAPGYDDSEKTTDAILDMLRNKDARFVGAIYGAADHAGHRHGPQSEEVKSAVLSIDRAVGRLIQGLKEAGIYQDTLIAFTADHGMSAFEKKSASEPAKILKDAGFKVASSNGELKDETQIVIVNAGVRMIYFRKPLSDEQKQKVMSLLSNIEGAEVLDRKKLDALGCHNNRSGDLMVSPLPGFTMSHAGKEGGQHGRFAERNPVLFFRGPGFKQAATLDEAQTVDVVPTLLHLVNIPPASSVDGKVIPGVLSN
jgi:predicted AlkP superfamily pyrophosphatase or phosphodiesterase